MIMLLLSLLFTGLGVPVGIGPVTLGGSLKLIYLKALVPFFSLIGEILKAFSPWGFIVVIVLLLLLKGPEWLRESLKSARLKIGAFEYDPTGNVASVFKKELGEATRVVESANTEIAEAYEAAKNFASQLRDRYQVGALTSKVSIAIAGKFDKPCPEDYQLTLYLPDFVFSDRLLQFTEYYDRKGEQVSEGKAGRTFSIRYGIIGRVWRSGVAEIEGELISREDRELLANDPKHGPIERFIARRWGLTPEEAFRIKEYNSYCAIRLDVADNKVGVIFFYSRETNAFGSDSTREKTLNAIEGVLEQSSLLGKLLEISHEVAPWSGRVQIFRNS
jgi:Sec-independent protein translocase protein TatA